MVGRRTCLQSGMHDYRSLTALTPFGSFQYWRFVIARLGIEYHDPHQLKLAIVLRSMPRGYIVIRGN